MNATVFLARTVPETNRQDAAAKDFVYGGLAARALQMSRRARCTERLWGHVARRMFPWGVIAVVAFLVGCQQKDVVEPLKRPEEVREAMEREKARKAQRKASPSPTAAARRRAASGQPRAAQTPAPSVTPTPEIVPTPLVIEASAMWTDKGVPDPAGGKMLPRNGFLQIDRVEVPFPIREVVLEMKGTSAGGVWPEVDLNMYNRTAAKNFFPWPRDYVTTSTFTAYAKKVEPPMPPGTYLVTFRYYNHSQTEAPGEKRSVTLRRLELRP